MVMDTSNKLSELFKTLDNCMRFTCYEPWRRKLSLAKHLLKFW